MTTESQTAINLLKSIDVSLKQIALSLIGDVPNVAKGGGAPNDPYAANVASDSDLDGQHGDPVNRYEKVRDWTGGSQKGKKFSECPAAFLDALAKLLDFLAKKGTEEGDRNARFKALDAGRARGWAARIRAGYKAPDQGFGDNLEGGTSNPFEEPTELTDDDIPF